MNPSNEQNKKVRECKILRLTIGEYIISYISKIDRKFYVLENPMLLQTIEFYNKNLKLKKTKISIRPWIEYSDDIVYFLPKNMVIITALPDSEILDIYNKALLELSDEKLLDDSGPSIDDDYDADSGPNTGWKNSPRITF